MYNQIQLLNEKIEQESGFLTDLDRELRKVVIGQQEMVDKLLVAILAGGHVLLEGVPGLAKTLTINSLAKAIDAGFQRIQFTPDLLPADLVGTMIYNQKEGSFFPKKGPVFTNIILADEINRAPAKVQSALLEAMQEKQVTIGDTSYPLPTPFFVLATQNPIEQEGTYPLPEAQVDRFMLKIKVGYPSREDEHQIMELNTAVDKQEIQPVVSIEKILAARNVVREIYVDDKVKDYILDVVFATRDPKRIATAQPVTQSRSRVSPIYGAEEPEQNRNWADDMTGLIEFGASPRATINLNLAARAHAFLRRRGYVTPEDVKAVGADVLRHRVILSFEAEAENLDADQIVQAIFERVEVP